MSREEERWDVDRAVAKIHELKHYPVQSAIRHFPEDFDKPAFSGQAGRQRNLRRSTSNVNS